MIIQVVQDVVCPWCRIGHFNLNAAIEKWVAAGHEAPQVQWFPYQLDPLEAGSKENFRERFTQRKGLPEEAMQQMFQRVTDAGAAIGVKFNFANIEFAQNTILAHQLILLTPPEHQDALIEALHKAYFEDGCDIEDRKVLLEVASAAGVPNEDLPRLDEQLSKDVARDQVMQLIDQVQQVGVSGVPFFIFDGKLAVNGAQPPEVMLQAMEQVSQVPAAD